MSKDNVEYWKQEIIKCEDPIYFFENYCTINGECRPLGDMQKEQIREWIKLRDKSVKTGLNI